MVARFPQNISKKLEEKKASIEKPAWYYKKKRNLTILLGLNKDQKNNSWSRAKNIFHRK